MRSDDNETNRRKVLQLTGAGVTTGIVGLAGCLGDPDDDPTEDDDDNGDADDGDDDDALDQDDFDEIVITQGEFPDIVDPVDHITGPYFNVYDHVYEPLFDFVPGEGIEPRIVTDWEHTGDGSVELEIQEGVMFHNGDELMASDIAYTMERQINPDVGPASDQVAGLGSIEGAEATGDYELTIEYSGAPDLAEFEFGNYARAMNEAWTEEQETSEGAIVGDDEEIFNGTGPFEVVDFEPDVQIVLEPFDDYWGDVPDFEQVIFNGDGESSGRVSALRTGESQLIDNVLPDEVPDVRDEDELDIREVTTFRNIFLVMKNEHEPFDSEEFRQAMNYAVDNEEIINTVLSGYGAPMSQPTPPEVNGYNPDLDPYPHDLEQAEELVEDSGHAGVEITLTVPEGRYLNDAEVGQLAADMIDDLPNVDCEADIVEFPEVSDANSAGVDDGEVPFYLIGWGVITGDADYGMAGFFMEGGGVQNFRDEELDEALAASQVEEDPDEREALLMDINEMAREKAPWVFLHQQEGIYGINDAIDWDPREDESIFVWDMN